MENIRKTKEQGITLVALIVTIIVLLILATISIAVITGRNGIIDRANRAKELTKIEEYREDLQLIGEGLQPERVINKLTSKEFMDRYQEKIKKDERYEKVERKDNETIIVTTKEGYVYKITTDKVEYIGKKGEIITPDLQESDIDFKAEPSEWTNQDVIVEIEKQNKEIENYTLQYSTDAKTWHNYTEPITMENNGAIYARLINDIGEPGKYATGNIQNIDKEIPIVENNTNGGTYRILADNETTAVTTTLTASDEGDSGLNILQYQYSTSQTIPDDNDTNWKNFTNGEEITEALTGGTYYLYTKVTDNAGNRAPQTQETQAYTITYQIKYDANGGTGEPEEQTKTHGINLKLSETQPTRSFYEFSGWSTQSTSAVAQYQPGGEYDLDLAKTLYAVWGENPAVEITTQPTAATVVAGNNVTFTTQATGNGELSYQWYYKTSSTGEGTAIQGATSPNYTYTSAIGDNGRYLYCIVTSTVGSSTKTETTDAVLLTVQPANYSIVNSGITTYYTDLATAHAGAVSGGGATGGGTITVIQNVADNSTVEINKVITLNMNGKTITRQEAIYTSQDGTANLTITGGGTITSRVRVLMHPSGTITVNGTTLVSPNSATIATGIGNFYFKSGTIQTKTNGVIMAGTGYIEMSGGTIKDASNPTEGYMKVAVNYGGTFKMTGGTITTSNANGIRVMNGTCTMTGGTITSNYYVGFQSDGGTSTITGGTITANAANNQGRAIEIEGGTVNFGSNSSAKSTTNPAVTATGYGVNVIKGTFNFYNGILKGIVKSCNGTISGKRSGATLRNNIKSGSYYTAYYQ